MHALETRIAETMMRDLIPCDLGDGIEVVHDVEEWLEIEMECELDEEADYYEALEILHAPAMSATPVEEVSMPYLAAFVRSSVWDTLPFAPFEPIDLEDAAQTRPFVRDVVTVPYPLYSAPYERVEVRQEELL